jgi:RimJ/RimL family protein N-acetyltransferase
MWQRAIRGAMARRSGSDVRVEDLSPGWRTDFLRHRVDAEVRELPDCLVVRSPGQENFYWGNCLMLPALPDDADLAHWLRRFDEEVAAGRPGVRHVAIGIISEPPPADALPSWIAAGFDRIEVHTMLLRPGQLRAGTPPRAAPLHLRQMALPEGIAAHVELQMSDPFGFEPSGYRLFRQRQMERFAKLQADGLADWFGLWCGQTLVADCGLLYDGTLGRFQNVMTHPDWRRRGLCSAMVHAVCRHAFEQRGLTELLMCADPDDVAIGIYESLGFASFGREWGVQRYPQEDADARRSHRLSQHAADA